MSYLLLEELSYEENELEDMRNLAAAVFQLEQSETSDKITKVLKAVAGWPNKPGKASLCRSPVSRLYEVLLPRRSLKEAAAEEGTWLRWALCLRNQLSGDVGKEAKRDDGTGQSWDCSKACKGTKRNC